MNMNDRPGWHAGGTGAPSRRKRGGQLTRILGWLAAEAVPVRARWAARSSPSQSDAQRGSGVLNRATRTMTITARTVDTASSIHPDSGTGSRFRALRNRSPTGGRANTPRTAAATARTTSGAFSHLPMCRVPFSSVSYRSSASAAIGRHTMISIFPAYAAEATAAASPTRYRASDSSKTTARTASLVAHSDNGATPARLKAATAQVAPTRGHRRPAPPRASSCFVPNAVSHAPAARNNAAFVAACATRCAVPPAIAPTRRTVRFSPPSIPRGRSGV